jgi:hypothetical protein
LAFSGGHGTKFLNMSEAHDKLAKILRTKPEVLLDLEDKLGRLTDKKGVIEKIMEQDHFIVDRTLADLGLKEYDRNAKNVYESVIKPIDLMDQHLYEFLGKPEMPDPKSCDRLCQAALTLSQIKPGFFIKKESAVRMLEKFPPANLLEHFGYKTVAELIEKEGFASVFSALRFAQDEAWMHKFFEEGYSDLTADDFEERDVELKVLELKWQEVARKFLKKKHHNVSHLKELGIIFVVPVKLDIIGETLRTLVLLLHYLNEVPFYSKLFKKFSGEPDFAAKFKSLLRGDVPEGELPEGMNFRIVQRYLAKEDNNDFRLFEPHINPEAEHWYKAEGNLAMLAAMPGMEKIKGGLSFGFWQELDFVGDFFPDGMNGSEDEELVSFDLIDLNMSLVGEGMNKYLYHQQEALWNKIFIEYLGRDKIEELLEENIIKGYITL